MKDVNTMKKLISLIIPCYNEEESIKILYSEIKKVSEELKDYDVECVFVDDGSADDTLGILREIAKADSNVKYISFSRNFGKESAMYAGFCNAKGDYVAVMDADMQDPPSLLPQMVRILENGGYDSVATRRIGRKGEPVIRSFFARLFYKIINHISDADIVDGARDFRLMKSDMVKAIVSMSERQRFSKGIFGWVGFSTYWMPYENIKRVAGETKWSFFKLFRYSVSGIVNFSDTPLSLITASGALLCIASLPMLFLTERFKYFAVLLLLAGIQLIATGIIGKYISVINSEIKKRPHYIVAETNDKSVERIR